MRSSDDALLSYLRRVQAVKDQKDTQLSVDEMRATALELGISDAELAAADQEAEKRIERGRGFLRHGRLMDALKDLTEAAALRPQDVDTLHLLARAHLDAFRRTRKEPHRAQAEQLARFCLELAPDHDASYTLLNNLDTLADRRTLAVIVAVSALAVLVAAAFIHL